MTATDKPRRERRPRRRDLINSDRTKIWVRGLCLNSNYGNGGWSFIVFGDTQQIGCGNELDTTAPRMDMTAIIKALIHCSDTRIQAPVIFTCCEYCAKTLSTWALKWRRRGWDECRKKNLDLVREALELKEELGATILWENRAPEGQRAWALAQRSALAERAPMPPTGETGPPVSFSRHIPVGEMTRRDREWVEDRHVALQALAWENDAQFWTALREELLNRAEQSQPFQGEPLRRLAQIAASYL